jgi:hypothetical protein
MLLKTVLAAALAAAPAASREPRWDASLELSAARLGNLDETAMAAGLRLSYRLSRHAALDAGALRAGELGQPPFSASQTELTLGLRLGPQPDPFGFFVVARGGALRFAEAPAPLACVAIFPPPLACVLAGGHTAAVAQLGAGVERRIGSAGLLRLEIGDRLARLPGPSFDSDGEIHDDDFWSHELRAAVSIGLRF